LPSATVPPESCPGGGFRSDEVDSLHHWRTQENFEARANSKFKGLKY
jgi:hypothetical protein